eukprot:scaffold1878_cov355-Prasinococcus_capsulatus_cf.AAC.8
MGTRPPTRSPGRLRRSRELSVSRQCDCGHHPRPSRHRHPAPPTARSVDYPRLPHRHRCSPARDPWGSFGIVRYGPHDAGTTADPSGPDTASEQRACPRSNRQLSADGQSASLRQPGSRGPACLGAWTASRALNQPGRVARPLTAAPSVVPSQIGGHGRG